MVRLTFVDLWLPGPPAQTIVILPTGTGKTFISVMWLKVQKANLSCTVSIVLRARLVDSVVSCGTSRLILLNYDALRRSRALCASLGDVIIAYLSKPSGV